MQQQIVGLLWNGRMTISFQCQIIFLTGHHIIITNVLFYKMRLVQVLVSSDPYIQSRIFHQSIMTRTTQLLVFSLVISLASCGLITSIQIIRDPHRLAFPVSISKDGVCSYSTPGVSETQIIVYFDNGTKLQDTSYGFTTCPFNGWNVDFYDGNNQILINDKCRDLDFVIWRNQYGYMRIQIDGKDWYLEKGYPMYGMYWRVNVNEWKVTITEITKYKGPAISQ